MRPRPFMAILAMMSSQLALRAPVDVLADRAPDGGSAGIQLVFVGA